MQIIAQYCADTLELIAVATDQLIAFACMYHRIIPSVSARQNEGVPLT